MGCDATTSRKHYYWEENLDVHEVPIHPGALAQANLSELNLSVAEAARRPKVTRRSS